jgi:cytochrome c-type protein NapC
MMQKSKRSGGIIAQVWRRVAAAGPLLVIGAFAAGVMVWGAFNWTLDLVSTESFCISCHEMHDNVYSEYQTKIHYQNRTGVRATCPDCHLPKDWPHRIARQFQASNELWHHMIGSVDTPAKFNDKRLRLAQSEWARMKSTDSRECRNCHNYQYMDYAAQDRRGSAEHQKGFSEGKTCIDCHKGISHTLPASAQDIDAPKASTGEPEPALRGVEARPSV